MLVLIWEVSVCTLLFTMAIKGFGCCHRSLSAWHDEYHNFPSVWSTSAVLNLPDMQWYSSYENHYVCPIGQAIVFSSCGFFFFLFFLAYSQPACGVCLVNNIFRLYTHAHTTVLWPLSGTTRHTRVSQCQKQSSSGFYGAREHWRMVRYSMVFSLFIFNFRHFFR